MAHWVKKLRFRFGLKWLLLLGPLLAAGVGMYHKRVSDRQRVESLVASIAPNSTRSLIEYDYEFDDAGTPVAGARSRAPTVLLKAFGPSYFHEIVGVDLDGVRISISDLASLTSLKNLRRLDLEYNDLTPECLQTISTLKNLERLDLQETGLRDVDLKCLESLPNLRWLLLAGRQITDEGLQHLRNAERLESLSVRFSSVRGSGLANLRCEATLTKLDLYESPINDESIEIILRFKKLMELDLSDAELSEGVVDRLASLRSLSTLRLCSEPSAAIMASLKDALPTCKIEFKRQ